MKKLLFILSISIVFFASCIPNPEEDPDPITPAASLLLNKTIDTYDTGDVITTTYLYNGKKLAAITEDSSLMTLFFTYEGDLITKIESKDDAGSVIRTFTYEYDDTKRLVAFKNIDGVGSSGIKETYVYNADGTISVTTFTGDAEEQTETDGTTRTITFLNGEISKITTTEDGSISYTYDNKNNPLKNVTGLGKIAFADATAKAVKHNVITQTVTDGLIPELYTYTYVYNASNYPHSKRTEDATGDYDTQYFYQ